MLTQCNFLQLSVLYVLTHEAKITCTVLSRHLKYFVVNRMNQKIWSIILETKCCMDLFSRQRCLCFLSSIMLICNKMITSPCYDKRGVQRSGNTYLDENFNCCADDTQLYLCCTEATLPFPCYLSIWSKVSDDSQIN